MYCGGCGQLLEANQPACARCGRPVLAVPAAVAGGAFEPPQLAARRFRVRRNLRTLGILWVVYAFWNVFQLLIAATVLTGMSGVFGDRWGMNPGFFWDRFPFYNAPWVVTLITVITGTRALLAATTGFALLWRAPWGRTLAIVTSALTIFKPIVGTILAIYTLWVLVPAASAQEYESITVPGSLR